MVNNKRDYWKEKLFGNNYMKPYINGKQVTTKSIIHNALNNYFVEMGPQLENTNNTTVKPLP